MLSTSSCPFTISTPHGSKSGTITSRTFFDVISIRARAYVPWLTARVSTCLTGKSRFNGHLNRGDDLVRFDVDPRTTWFSDGVLTRPRCQLLRHYKAQHQAQPLCPAHQPSFSGPSHNRMLPSSPATQWLPQYSAGGACVTLLVASADWSGQCDWYSTMEGSLPHRTSP
jgi:hypothetical protein